MDSIQLLWVLTLKFHSFASLSKSSTSYVSGVFQNERSVNLGDTGGPPFTRLDMLSSLVTFGSDVPYAHANLEATVYQAKVCGFVLTLGTTPLSLIKVSLSASEYLSPPTHIDFESVSSSSCIFIASTLALIDFFTLSVTVSLTTSLTALSQPVLWWSAFCSILLITF